MARVIRGIPSLAVAVVCLVLPGAAAAQTLPGDPVPATSIESLAQPQLSSGGEKQPSGLARQTMNPAELRAAKDGKAGAPGQKKKGPGPRSDAINPLNQGGVPAGGATPPDPTGAIGPSNYIEMVNRQVAVYSRASLGLVAQIDLNNFVGKPSDLQCDPQIVWDPQANRWFYAALDCDGQTANFLLFGWSKTSSPTPLPSSSSAGNWCRFQQSTGSIIDDYPKLGMNDKHLVIGTNVFQGNSFLTSRIWAYEKPPAGDQSCAGPAGFSFGSPASPLTTADSDVAFTPVPAQSADGGPNAYVVEADYPDLGSASQIMAWHVTGGGGGGAPSLVSDGNFNVASFAFPLNVPQPSSSRVLDSSDTRLTQAIGMSDPDAAGAKGIWTQHTVDGPGTPSIARWYELLPSLCNGVTCPGSGLKQAGTVSDPSQFIFNAAISPTHTGQDAVIQYNLGSSAQLAQIRARWHSAGTAPGSTLGDILIGTSTAAAQDFSCNPGPCRWGDYAGATPDPVADDTVWATNQLLGSPSGTNPAWTTRNFSIQVFNGYARPKGATPLRVSLVPAYNQCTATNRTHGPPLASGSCAPPVRASSQLTVGTPDANGQPANSVGSMLLNVVPGDPLTPADEADVAVNVNITDVRRVTTLADYTGQLQAVLIVRLTDAANGPSTSEDATTSGFPFPVTVPCVATGDTTVGSTCSITTSFDAVTPGAAQERKRSIWQLGAVEVLDGGADGLAATTPNTPFARQGIFVP
jgi:hypothetical protein